MKQKKNMYAEDNTAAYEDSDDDVVNDELAGEAVVPAEPKKKLISTADLLIAHANKKSSDKSIVLASFAREF